MKKLLRWLPACNAFFFAVILSGSLILLDPSPAWAAKCRAEVTCGDGGKISCEADGPNAQCEAEPADEETGEDGYVYCSDGDGSTRGFCRE